MTDRNRQRARRKTSYVARVYSLNEVAARIGLSERWVRELIKLHGLNIRRVPCAGSGQFIFSRDDLKQIEGIHTRNQEELRLRYPSFYAAVGKPGVMRRGAANSYRINHGPPRPWQR